MWQQKSPPDELPPAGILKRLFCLCLPGPHLKERLGGVAFVEMFQEGAAEHGGVGPDVGGNGGKLVRVLQTD